jgi:archaeal type IV pilus assembly protein PilA
MNFSRINKNSKAISPIFATLILIAIAVIAGVVVYMFTSGTLATMTGGGTVAQEHVAIQGASVTSSTTIAVYAQYMDGGSAIAINGAIIRDATGTSQTGTCSSNLPTSGALTTVTVTTAALTSGHTYTVTLTSSKGGSFVSPAFEAP